MLLLINMTRLSLRLEVDGTVLASYYVASYS